MIEFLLSFLFRILVRVGSGRKVEKGLSVIKRLLVGRICCGGELSNLGIGHPSDRRLASAGPRLPADTSATVCFSLRSSRWTAFGIAVGTHARCHRLDLRLCPHDENRLVEIPLQQRVRCVSTLTSATSSAASSF
jgi:hypothetical protein